MFQSCFECARFRNGRAGDAQDTGHLVRVFQTGSCDGTRRLRSDYKSMREINYNHLYYFHVVATEGSLVEASRKLGVAPSTISQQIRLLESSLAAQLFDRIGSGMRLTPAGKRALEQTHVMFEASTRLEQAVRPSAVPDKVKLEVGVCSSVERTFPSRTFAPLFTSQDVMVRLRHGESDELAHRLRAFEIDLLLTDSLPSRPQVRSLAVEPVRRTSLVAAARPDVAARVQEFPKDAGPIPLVHYTTSTPYRWAVDEYLRQHGVQPPVIAEVDEVELMAEVAARGDCWCVIPRLPGDQRLEEGRLQVIGHLGEAHEATVYAVYMDKDPSQLVLDAIQQLKQES